MILRLQDGEGWIDKRGLTEKEKTMITLKRGSMFAAIVLLVVFCLCVPSQAVDHTTIKYYPEASFSTGWTHTVNTDNGILYYKTATGASAFGRFDVGGNHNTLKSFNFSAGWTTILTIPAGILFYNAKTGAAAVEQINSAGNNTTLKTFNFMAGWTNILDTPRGVFFYNSQTGAAALEKIE